MAATVRQLTLRALSLLGVLLAVLVLLVVVLGATGFSDNLLRAQVSEDVRAMRQSLSQTIRDPAELERTVTARQAELESFYGLDEPWYTRLPAAVGRVLRLDLGESRSLRTASGSREVGAIVLERLPFTVLLLTTSSLITAAVGLLIGVRMATRVGTPLGQGGRLLRRDLICGSRVVAGHPLHSAVRIPAQLAAVRWHVLHPAAARNLAAAARSRQARVAADHHPGHGQRGTRISTPCAP